MIPRTYFQEILGGREASIVINFEINTVSIGFKGTLTHLPPPPPRDPTYAPAWYSYLAVIKLRLSRGCLKYLDYYSNKFYISMAQHHLFALVTEVYIMLIFQLVYDSLRGSENRNARIDNKFKVNFI